MHKMRGKQGDQMSLQQNRPKCCPTHYLAKLIHNLHRGKSSQKIATSFFNYHPIPRRDSISRLMTPQAETLPLDHAAMTKLLLLYFSENGQRKLLPKCRKIAQSGHPDDRQSDILMNT
jgi:hypothetical protein